MQIYFLTLELSIWLGFENYLGFVCEVGLCM